MHIRHRKDYDEQKAVVMVLASISGLRRNAKCAIVRESMSEVWVTYVQGRLTLIFSPISCGLHSKAANDRVNTVVISSDGTPRQNMQQNVNGLTTTLVRH